MQGRLPKRPLCPELVDAPFPSDEFIAPPSNSRAKRSCNSSVSSHPTVSHPSNSTPLNVSTPSNEQHAPTPVQDLIVDQEWLSSPAFRALCERTRGPDAKPVRLLGISLFDGIGGLWQCFAPFEKSCFNWTAQFSSEVDPGCLAVLRHRFPRLQHIGDVRALDIEFWRGILFANSGQFDAVVLAGGGPRANRFRLQVAPQKALLAKTAAFSGSLPESPGTWTVCAVSTTVPVGVSLRTCRAPRAP